LNVSSIGFSARDSGTHQLARDYLDACSFRHCTFAKKLVLRPRRSLRPSQFISDALSLCNENDRVIDQGHRHLTVIGIAGY